MGGSREKQSELPAFVSPLFWIVLAGAIYGIVASTTAYHRYVPLTLCIALGWPAYAGLGWWAGARFDFRRVMGTSALSGLTFGLVSGSVGALLGVFEPGGFLLYTARETLQGLVIGSLSGRLGRVCRGHPIRAAVVGTLTVAAGAVLVVFLDLTGTLFWKPFADRRYDPSAWRRESGRMNENSRRGSMVCDLERRIIRRGMTRAEVIAHLGEPDGTKDPDDYGYVIGMWTGFRMDFDTFDVLFDDQGRVVETRIVQH